MSVIKVSEPHHTSAVDAVGKISAFEEMMKKYGVKSVWSGTTAKLKGTGVSGGINVTDTSCDVEVKLGVLARRLVDPVRLEASIRKRLKTAFNPEA
ncbi:MAG: putative polyhydroxyalkanoate system protein [Bradymonadia bacterium]|jgi:putative polyhydroxyalkanoate system protein